MKKAKLLFLFVLSFLVCTPIIKAVQVGPQAYDSTDYATCYAAADTFKTITISERSYYYTYCFRATCSHNVYNLANMVQRYGYTCQNGNKNPYLRLTSDGCHYYTGSCGTTNSTYCTRVFYIDCNRTVSNQPFTTTTTTRSTSSRVNTTKPTTRKTTTSSKRVTTKSTTKTTPKKTTTKKTTTKTPTKNTTQSTKKTGTQIITPTTDPTTSSTTSITLPTSVHNARSTDVKSVSVNGHKINVTNDKNNYNIKLKDGINEVDVDVELQYDSSSYTVSNNENIPDDIPKEGIDITIEITGADTEKREIVINVKRQTAESGDCQLSSIYHSEYFVDFSKNVMDYTLKLPKGVKTLNPEIEPGNDEQQIEVKGDENLKNNSKIEIEVTAGDGTVCNYTITIKKESNTWKYILIIFILIIILAVAGILLMKYLKKSKGTYRYE